MPSSFDIPEVHVLWRHSSRPWILQSINQSNNKSINPPTFKFIHIVLLDDMLDGHHLQHDGEHGTKEHIPSRAVHIGQLPDDRLGHRSLHLVVGRRLRRRREFTQRQRSTVRVGWALCRGRTLESSTRAIAGCCQGRWLRGGGLYNQLINKSINKSHLSLVPSIRTGDSIGRRCGARVAKSSANAENVRVER